METCSDYFNFCNVESVCHMRFYLYFQKKNIQRYRSQLVSKTRLFLSYNIIFYLFNSNTISRNSLTKTIIFKCTLIFKPGWRILLISSNLICSLKLCECFCFVFFLFTYFLILNYKWEIIIFKSKKITLFYTVYFQL